MNIEDTVSTNDAMKLLGLSRQGIFYHVEQDRLSIERREGGSCYFKRTDVMKLKKYLDLIHPPGGKSRRGKE